MREEGTKRPYEITYKERLERKEEEEDIKGTRIIKI